MNYSAKKRMEKISARARHLEESAWANPDKLFDTRKTDQDIRTAADIARVNNELRTKSKTNAKRGGKLGLFVLFEVLALLLMR